MTQVSALFLSLSTSRLREECERLGITVLCRRSAIAALIAAGLISQASAQQARICLPRDDMAREIDRAYGEKRATGGEAHGNAYELFVNDETRTWTMVVTTGRGVSCIVASGEGWEDTLGGRKYGPRS